MNQKRLEFPGWPWFAEDEIARVGEILRSGRVNYWTGEEGRLFEKEFAEAVDRQFAVAVANGTLALELALYSLGIGSGDEVIVPCRTFIATASAVVRAGAVPVFVDIDSDSQNLNVETILPAVTGRTRAIIPVHLAGWPCDMDAIVAFAHDLGLLVVEDCAQAHGARIGGRPVGSFGDAAAFSFCQDKILTTGGEGGMLVTDSREVWERAWSYKDHGKDHRSVIEEEHKPGFRWLHASEGTNMRMTEMQAAIGRLQLEKLGEWVKTRRRNAMMLEACFKGLNGTRMTFPPIDVYHSYYKYYVFVRPDVLKRGWDRNRVMMEINSFGVPCSVGICSEVYLERALSAYAPDPAKYCQVGRELGATSLMFQVHPTLTSENVDRACQAIVDVFRRAS